MNRIEKLLEELCPDGVEYKPLGKIFDSRNGYTPSKSKPEYWESGTVPWFRMDDIRENGTVLEDSSLHINSVAVKKSGLFPKDSIIVATSATIGVHALITQDFLCNQRFTSLSVKSSYKDLFNIKFLYYYCFMLDAWCVNNTTQSSFSSVDMKKFYDFKFPIPPLAVQEEIVKILDSFTMLEAELEAELEARRKQYQFYRNELLSFRERERVSFSSVGSICDIKRGRVISKGFLRDNPGIYPVYSSQTINSGIFGMINSYDFDGEYITWTTDGANAGTVVSRSGKFSCTNVCGLLKVKNDKVIPKYLAYILGSVAKRYVNAGMGNPKLMSNQMASILVPVPSLEEQARIVDVLDRFDALVNDISSGLPAEIAARRKQYEYYRDKLLTFPEKKTAA